MGNPSFHSMPGAAMAALLVLGTAGCVLLHPGTSRDPVEEDLRQADRLFSARHLEGALVAAVDAYHELATRYPADPRILGRLARAQYARAYGLAQDTRSEAEFYEEARATAWSCLLQVQAVAQGTATGLADLDPRVVQRIPASHRDCLVWATASWARWAILRDPTAVSLDLHPLGLLAERVVALKGEDQHGQADHVMGLTLSLHPPMLRPDGSQPRTFLEEAIRLEPADLTRQVDLAEYVLIPDGDVENARAVLEHVLPEREEHMEEPWVLENRRARTRTRTILAGLQEEPGTGSGQTDADSR